MLLEDLHCPGAIQVVNHSLASKGSRAKHRNKRRRRGRRAADITAHTPRVSLSLAWGFQEQYIDGTENEVDSRRLGALNTAANFTSWSALLMFSE